jgi:hypothetical protein
VVVVMVVVVVVVVVVVAAVVCACVCVRGGGGVSPARRVCNESGKVVEMVRHDSRCLLTRLLEKLLEHREVDRRLVELALDRQNLTGWQARDRQAK